MALQQRGRLSQLCGPAHETRQLRGQRVAPDPAGIVAQYREVRPHQQDTQSLAQRVALTGSRSRGITSRCRPRASSASAWS
jgi:hypothetical protein